MQTDFATGTNTDFKLKEEFCSLQQPMDKIYRRPAR